MVKSHRRKSSAAKLAAKHIMSSIVKTRPLAKTMAKSLVKVPKSQRLSFSKKVMNKVLSGHLTTKKLSKAIKSQWKKSYGKKSHKKRSSHRKH
jgi:hypothetical protein